MGAVDREYLDTETHQTLCRWARWCRGNYFPDSFWVACGSLESQYLPPGAKVFETAEEALQASLEMYPQRAVNEPEAVRVETIVMRMRKDLRMALRLKYVAYKRVPLNQKLKLLGCNADDYNFLVWRAENIFRDVWITT